MRLTACPFFFESILMIVEYSSAAFPIASNPFSQSHPNEPRLESDDYAGTLLESANGAQQELSDTSYVYDHFYAV